MVRRDAVTEVETHFDRLGRRGELALAGELSYRQRLVTKEIVAR